MATAHFGRIIGLRAEFTRGYRVLHEHVFPGVLDRLSRSNIRNYSIYLVDGILFAYLEYVGSDYAADNAAIAADPTTQDWWTLTDPMQFVLAECPQGERWATLPAWYAAERPVEAGADGRSGSRRLAFVADRPAGLPPLRPAVRRGGSEGDLEGLQKVRVYLARERLYIYVEAPLELDQAAVADRMRCLLPAAGPLEPIEEVFHTDGLEAAG